MRTISAIWLLVFLSVCGLAGAAESEVPELTVEELPNYRFEREEVPPPNVESLSFGQIFALRSQRRKVADLITRHYGLDDRRGTIDDLDLLQGLVDKSVVGADDLTMWQALGVVFGDILTENLDLHWVSFQDELGTSKALQWGQTNHFVFPVTMLSKRRQFRQEIDLRAMYAKIVAETRRFEDFERNKLKMPSRSLPALD